MFAEVASYRTALLSVFQFQHWHFFQKRGSSSMVHLRYNITGKKPETFQPATTRQVFKKETIDDFMEGTEGGKDELSGLAACMSGWTAQ